MQEMSTFEYLKEIELYNRIGTYYTRDIEYPWAIDNSGIRPGMTVLDAGCIASPLSIFFDYMGCHAISIDRDEHNNPHPLWSNFCVMDIGLMGFKPRVFDIVFCISVLEHVREQDLQETITDLHRVLKPGGPLVLTMDVDNSCREDGFLDLYIEAVKNKFDIITRKDWGDIIGLICKV